MKESRIWKRKSSTWTKNTKTGTKNPEEHMWTGFHNETSESEVKQLLQESITEIRMTIENARIECPAKPITLAFIHFKNDDERNKYVRSANMLRKELRGRNLIKKECGTSNTAFM